MEPFEMNVAGVERAGMRTGASEVELDRWPDEAELLRVEVVDAEQVEVVRAERDKASGGVRRVRRRQHRWRPARYRTLGGLRHRAGRSGLRARTRLGPDRWHRSALRAACDRSCGLVREHGAHER